MNSEVARHSLAEAGGEPELAALWAKASAQLSPLIGTAGVAAVFRRAAQLASAKQGDNGAAPTHAATAAILFDLLARLIGPSLARRVSQPGAPACTLAPDVLMREANEHLVVAALACLEVEAAALDAHRRQVAFLATVAHELRNPLMPLRLAAHMLDRARTDDVAHAKLQATITGQVAQMTRLIGDLLDGSRLSTGKFRLERTLIDIGGVIDRAIETCKPAMDGRGHSFVRDLPPAPIRVLGDTVRLVQVFSNILENSSKYTPEGGAIALRAVVRGNAVVVTVSDNGIGISAKALPHVFDLFVRDAHATTHDQGGLGIGLSVVRELVRAHEGAVVARSAGQNHGSEFAVTLPLALTNTRLTATTV